METIQKGLRKQVPSGEEQKGNLTPITTWWQWLLTLRHQPSTAWYTGVIVCCVSENWGYRERSPGKSGDYCNGNLMCLAHFPHKEKQTGILRSYKQWTRDSNTKPRIAPSSKVIDESSFMWPFSQAKRKQTCHDYFTERKIMDEGEGAFPNKTGKGVWCKKTKFYLRHVEVIFNFEWWKRLLWTDRCAWCKMRHLSTHLEHHHLLPLLLQSVLFHLQLQERKRSVRSLKRSLIVQEARNIQTWRRDSSLKAYLTKQKIRLWTYSMIRC